LIQKVPNFQQSVLPGRADLCCPVRVPTLLLAAAASDKKKEKVFSGFLLGGTDPMSMQFT